MFFLEMWEKSINFAAEIRNHKIKNDEDQELFPDGGGPIDDPNGGVSPIM